MEKLTNEVVKELTDEEVIRYHEGITALYIASQALVSHHFSTKVKNAQNQEKYDMRIEKKPIEDL